jgi:hypothetical protein
MGLVLNLDMSINLHLFSPKEVLLIAFTYRESAPVKSLDIIYPIL